MNHQIFRLLQRDRVKIFGVCWPGFGKILLQGKFWSLFFIMKQKKSLGPSYFYVKKVLAPQKSKSKIKNQKSKINYQKSEIRNQKIKNQKSKIKNQISKIKNQKSEKQKSKIEKKSKINNQKSKIKNKTLKVKIKN